jgi:hypothetical protein
MIDETGVKLKVVAIPANDCLYLSHTLTPQTVAIYNLNGKNILLFNCKYHFEANMKNISLISY